MVPDGFEMLIADHRAVEALVDRFRASGDEALAQDLFELLTRHDEVERRALYPELRRLVDGGDDLADEAATDHARIAAAAAALHAAAQGDLSERVEDVTAAVAPHVEKEEAVLFPAMREAGVDASSLAQRVEAARDGSRPTTSGREAAG
jgi:hemerythrin superfamily protein